MTFHVRPVHPRICERCQRVVGWFYNGHDRMQQAKHRVKLPGGKWCREIRKAGTGEVIG